MGLAEDTIMQEFTTQFKVTQKQESIGGNNALQFTLTIIPDQNDVMGQLIVTTQSAEANEFFSTGKLFDVVIKPQAVPE